MPKKHRLLIVDDQLDFPRSSGEATRRELYEKLSSLFDLHFLESPSALRAIMDGGEMDAALVDFVLDDWGTDVSTVLRVIDGRVPVSLISQFWNPNFDMLRRVMEDYWVSRLFTWDEMVSPEGRDLVGFWIDMAIRHEEGVSPRSLDDDESFCVVQISDLQFGGALTETLAVDTELALQAIQTRWPKPPQVIALTGDIAERGRPKEYEEALAWLADFRSKLSGSTGVVDVVTIPGNHDLSWPLAMASRINVEERTVDVSRAHFPDLLAYSLAPYRQFSASLEPKERWATGSQFWVSGRYKRDGVILFGLNTCESVDDWGVETRALADRTVASMFSEIRAEKRASPDGLLVGFMHHPLYGAPDAAANPEVLRRSMTQNLGTILIVTGHAHTDDTDPLTTANASFIQVMGSTFTLKSSKRDEDTSRGFNLIEIKRSAGVVTGVEVTSLVFERSGVRAKETTVFARNVDGRLSMKMSD